MATPNERDLIPQGLPYGEGQATESAMREAGLPLGSRGVQAGSLPQSAEQPGELADLDPLLALEPLPQEQAAQLPRPPSFDEQMRELMLNAPSPFYRELARRVLLGRQE